MTRGRSRLVTSTDSFKAHGELQVGDKAYDIYRLAAVEGSETLPYSLKVLLENLLRTEDAIRDRADAEEDTATVDDLDRARRPGRRLLGAVEEAPGGIRCQGDRREGKEVRHGQDRIDQPPRGGGRFEQLGRQRIVGAQAGRLGAAQ